jgi:hypothetical protein
MGMAKQRTASDVDKRRSVFEWGLGSEDDVQEWLDSAPFEEKGILHLPEFEVIEAVRRRLDERAKHSDLSNGDVLTAYQELHDSAASSDIVCGMTVNAKRCGGIMDEEVTPFGIYYQCRRNPLHRIVK